jgi:hypothetical protein
MPLSRPTSTNGASTRCQVLVIDKLRQPLARVIVSEADIYWYEMETIAIPTFELYLVRDYPGKLSRSVPFTSYPSRLIQAYDGCRSCLICQERYIAKISFAPEANPIMSQQQSDHAIV